MHIGVLQPLLAGGVILCLAYYAFFIPILWRKPPGWYDNRYNVAAMAVLPVYATFLLIEGAPVWGTPFTCALVGMACARPATPVILEEELECEDAYETYAPYEAYAANW